MLVKGASISNEKIISSRNSLVGGENIDFKNKKDLVSFSQPGLSVLSMTQRRLPLKEKEKVVEIPIGSQGLGRRLNVQGQGKAVKTVTTVPRVTSTPSDYS